MGLFGNVFKSNISGSSSNVIIENEFNSFDEEISVICYVLSMSSIAFIVYSYEISINQMMKLIREKFASIDIGEEGIKHYTFSDGKIYSGNLDILWSYDPIVDEQYGLSAVLFSVCPIRGESETEEEWQRMVREIATLATGIKGHPVLNCTVDTIKIVPKETPSDLAKLVFPNEKLANSVRNARAVKI